MALGATVRRFDIELSDVDRGVYETLSLKVAQHPSETGPYLITRVLAYALELEEGLTFSAGLSSSQEPALWVRDLTDQLMAWIEVGTPAPSRLHKAAKAADRVAVYCHKEPAPWLAQLANERVHEAEKMALYGLPRATIRAIADAVERRNEWALSRMEDTLYLQTASKSYELALTRIEWPRKA
ncbi:MAG: YaeQ family protein [Proteobacteria bacterium]|nr:YaeQ family protein [Pseudomonadota bacterium]